MSLNKVTLIGNLGKDPEIRTTQDGKEIASFSLATTEGWKDKSTSEKKYKTEWHRIVVFGPLAGIVKNYVKKGSKLYVEGQLKTREWADKDGVKKQVTEIVLQNFKGELKMLDSKPKSEQANEVDDVDQANFDKSFKEVEDAFDSQELNDDIPF